MTKTTTTAFAALIIAIVTPEAASACAGGFFSFTNTLCPAQMRIRVCNGGEQGTNLLFTLRKGESLYFQTAPNSSYSWSCNGEPAAVCPTAYCVNGP